MRGLRIFLVFGIVFQIGCATPNKTIAAGMLSGAVLGAGIGYQFVHHGERRQFEVQNTIITSALFSMVAGGILAWHYREVEKAQVELSGRYARYRLCGANELPEALVKQMNPDGGESGGEVLRPEQIGDHAIALDDSTKWAFPTFRKRDLPPEKGDDQVLSDRYIWEILRPGRFVTRSQNPSYFLPKQESPRDSTR